MPNRPCKAGIRIKTEQKLKMPKRGRTAIQQSKREKAKVYFGECWTTPKKTLKRWKEWNRVKTLTRCWRCTQHTKTTTKPKTQEEETTKSTKESAIIERRKADPKRIFDRKPQPQEKLHPKLLKSPPTPVKTNPKIRRQTLSGIKTEFARKFFNARS